MEKKIRVVTPRHYNDVVQKKQEEKEDKTLLYIGVGLGLALAAGLTYMFLKRKV